jgi:two-component system cell cycle sensor histidine kinase/response regulator CckA
MKSKIDTVGERSRGDFISSPDVVEPETVASPIPEDEKWFDDVTVGEDNDRGDYNSYEGTQSINVEGLFTRDVSDTGSFDVWGGIWATTFGKVIQALPIPAFLVDQNHQIRVANQACAKISPFYETRIRTAFYELIPDAAAKQEARSTIDQVFLTRKSIVTEMVLQIEGSRIWGRLTFRSIRMSDERLVLVLVEDLTRERHQLKVNERLRAELEKRVLERTEQLRRTNEQLRQEVFERRKAEDALRESEARYRELFENASDAIYTHDLDGNYMSGNKAVESVIGYPREEFLRLNFRDIVLPEDLPKAEESVHGKSVENTGPHEVRIRAKDGSLRCIEFTSRFLREHGEPVAVQGSARDISDRRLLEEKLRQAAKMEAIGHLAGGIAHDFNNLLTAMLGYTDMLSLEVPENSSSKDKLAQIKDAAQRAATLTQQILAFGRKQLLEVKPLDLSTVIAGFEEMLRRIVGEDIEFETHYEPSIGVVHTDQGQIEQILMNLGVNARDAMPNGGRLIIETKNVLIDREDEGIRIDLEQGLYLMLAVTDTGVGMDDFTISRVFDPFFTTKQKGFGTGLGLFTVYGIVKQHGGHITVQSEPGCGTTIKIYLPQIEAELGKNLRVSTEQPTPSGTETVLVVEDEACVLSLTSDALQLLGYKTLTAEDPRKAREISSRYDGPIDLLLTDVVLPQMDGRSLYGKLSEGRPEMKVLFMSGHTDDFIVHHGVLDEGVYFLRKPFTLQALGRKIREVIDGFG